MSQGCVSLVLHAHLPYVRHPEHDFHLEELWFFEAMHETYLPLIEVGRNLERDGVPGTLTVSLSPPLMAMMDDDLLVRRFRRHLGRLIELAERERSRRPDGSRRQTLAAFYADRFRRLRELFVDTLDEDILGAFGSLEAAGRFELMTCAGTHGLLPLMHTDVSRRAHIQTARRAFVRRFGHSPSGMWLPECGYAPGLDALLAEADIDFSILESHGLAHADTPPVFGNASPIVSGEGVAFFGRDERASTQVWSAESGYPGHPHYREFYRDLGWELDRDELDPLPNPTEDRYDTGLKYHRVTGDVALDDKELYNPDRAESRVREHARDFVQKRIEHIQSLSPALEGRAAHLTCPYDAELFGHWWFEGPRFLEAVFREAAERGEIAMTSPRGFLERPERLQRVHPGASTWGEGGYFDVWLDDDNAWLYRHLHNAERAVIEWADGLENPDDEESLDARLVAQCGREVMLAQASDWAFILQRGTSVEYALSRTRDHLEAIRHLGDELEADISESDGLDEREERYAIFPELEPSLWQSPS